MLHHYIGQNPRGGLASIAYTLIMQHVYLLDLSCPKSYCTNFKQASGKSIAKEQSSRSCSKSEELCKNPSIEQYSGQDGGRSVERFEANTFGWSRISYVNRKSVVQLNVKVSLLLYKWPHFSLNLRF